MAKVLEFHLAPSPLLIATGEAIPLRGLEGVPGLPCTTQDEGQAGLACCDSWGRKESDTTDPSCNNTAPCLPDHAPHLCSHITLYQPGPHVDTMLTKYAVGMKVVPSGT